MFTATRYKKLAHLPKKTPVTKLFSITDFARKRKVTIGAIYMKIERVINRKHKWKDYKAYQFRGKIVIVEK